MSRHFAYKAGSGRVRVAATAALLLVAGLFAASVAGPSGASPPGRGSTTTTLVLTNPTTGNTTDLGAPAGAAPDVLAERDLTNLPGSGTPITTSLSVSDGSELNKGTVVLLQAVHVTATGVVTGNASGAFTPSTFTVPERGTTFEITVTYSQADTNLAINASLKKTTSTSPGPGHTLVPFDVTDTLEFADQGDEKLSTGFGATDCTSASTARVCGTVVLPNGIASAKAALSNGNDQVQFLAGLADLYVTPKPPATLILRCDKAYCKGKGVTNYTAKISLLASGGFVNSLACTTKGVLNSGEHFCTDYVASHRDNAGDLLLEVLFDRDMRGII